MRGGRGHDRREQPGQGPVTVFPENGLAPDVESREDRQDDDDGRTEPDQGTRITVDGATDHLARGGGRDAWAHEHEHTREGRWRATPGLSP